MHAGTEDTSLDPWDKEIVHFDIKFDNGKDNVPRFALSSTNQILVLVGASGTDDEHRDLLVFKVRNILLPKMDITDLDCVD